MSLNPDGASAGFYSQAGATAYLIEPAGAYSPAGASTTTDDLASTDGGARASVPTLAAAGASIPIPAAAEIVDPAGAYSPAAAIAPTTDPAGGASASAPTLAVPGASIPTPAAAEIVDPAGAYSPAAATTPTTDPARGASANAPTLAAAGASIPTPAVAEIVDPAGGAYRPAAATTPTTDLAGGASANAPTLAAAGASIPITAATSAAAEIVDPAGTNGGAIAPTLAAPGASIPVSEATLAAAKIVAPAGTYLPPGATAPIADPAGTYSAAGATAPTTDPAGTYSSPYALDRLFLEWKKTTPANVVLPFHSVTAVANYYGASSPEVSLAQEFFATNYGNTSATMLFTRIGLGQRPHLLGATLSNLTLAQLQSINGSLALTFDGYRYSGHVDLSGATSLLDAAAEVRAALNRNLQVAAVTSGSSIAPESTSFTGYTDKAHLFVTSVSPGATIEVGGVVSGKGIRSGAQIIYQLSGTPGGPGEYSLFSNFGTVSTPEAMKETYGVLTVGAVNSGTVALGQQVTGAGVLPLTGIDAHLSGSGPGSTWIVSNAQTVAGDLTTTAPPLAVSLDNNNFLDVQPNGWFGFDNDPSDLSYMSGTAADALGLTQASGAIDSTPGGQHPTTAQFMNQVLSETNQFGSFQSNEPRFDQALAAWAQKNPAYQFLTTNLTTSRAGSSLPTTDPAGTWSGPGQSAPTPADPGTYIPFTGATSASQEILDSPGFYSLAGASKPTAAQPGFYVPTAGASFETPVDPGYYQPHGGATKEYLALPPHITGTVTGQTTPSGQSDTPFSFVTITDKNILTSDSLSIQITGGGGKLTDGAGFSGLTESPASVYLLSGTAAAITSELDALVFTPNSFSATTTFTLTDTTSVGTSSVPDQNTTVTVTNGAPVVVSVANFLANQKTLDGTPGGFDILDTAANIAASLDKLNGDSKILAIVISDNGNIGAAVQQLTPDQTAIHKLQNANLSPARLAITDTTANIQAGWSTLVADSGEIASITPSNGPIVVSAATFLTDQLALDKIVGGFVVSDTAANVMADLDQLNDQNISTITISDNGQISASVAQLTTDATAIGDLRNTSGSAVPIAVNDTAGAVETGLSTLVADTGEIGSITIAAPVYPVVVSAAEFLADQSALDKIAGGFEVSDDAASLAAALSALNADPGVNAITADSGAGTLSGGAGVNAPNFSESGWATILTISEAVDYAGTFTQGSGSTLSISSADTFSLTRTASLSGATSGAGTLALWGGSATIDKGATISVSNWSISGAGTDVTLDESLTYAGSFSEGAGDTFVLSGGHLLLTGAASFAGGTVDGSQLLETEGTTTVSGLTIGGTVKWENTGIVNQSGGSVTIGDASGDNAILDNMSTGTYAIADDSGINRGSSTASNILNAGLIEKMGSGTGVSTIVPNVTNNGTIEVTSGTLELKGRILGTGSDTISGASTLQLDAQVSATQTVDFTGSGGELALHGPAVFAGSISGFDTAGAGSNDKIEVAAPWIFTGFTENAGGTQGTLSFANGSSTMGLTLLGNYNPADFHAQTLANHSTVITYTGASGLASLLSPISAAETHTSEFGVHEASGSARGDWGVVARWDGSVGHGPGPS